MRTTIAALGLFTLAVAGPAAGFALSLTIEYLRATSAGGDRVVPYGTLRPDDLGTPANNPWHEGVATDRLRSGAQFMLAKLRVAWQSRSHIEIVASLMVWTIPPVLAAAAGLCCSLWVVGWLSRPGYLMVPAVRDRVRIRIREQLRWLVIITVAVLPLCGMLAGQRHLTLGIGNGQGFACGVPTSGDILTTSVLAAAAGVCVGMIVLLGNLRRCVEPSDLLCWCGYSISEGTLARCPECGRPAPSMPPTVRLLGVSESGLRVIGRLACLSLLGLLSAWSSGLLPIRQVCREVLFGVETMSDSFYRLQIPAAWPVLIEFEDGVGLVVVEREVRWNAVPAYVGRRPASVTGVDVITRCGCAFWATGKTPRDTTPAELVYVSGSRSAATLSDTATLRCGSHEILLGHSIVDWEFTYYATRSVVCGFKTSHEIKGLENTISSIRMELRAHDFGTCTSPPRPKTGDPE
ncbi:MAG: hypothetical protein ACK4WH_07735 [Phycisphaerales bacterium]